MGLLAPAFFGLSLFIGGLVIFYIFRKQYDEEIVSSNILWDQVMNERQASKWWKKLQRQLLLLLQILILLLLMFALARPFLYAEGVEGDHVIFIVDSSATMAAFTDEETTRFGQAKADMLELADKLSREQAVSVISAGASPELAVAREFDKDLVKNQIEALDLTYEHSNFSQALSLAGALSQQQSASIHIFSDQVTEDMIEEASPGQPVHVVNYGTMTEGNISVMTFGVSSGPHKAEAVVTLKNEGVEAEAAELTVFADGVPAYSENVALPAGEETVISVEELPNGIYYKAEIKTEDSYALDNTAFAFASSEQAAVLYLIGDINPFLHKVLLQLGHEIVQAAELSDIHDPAAGSILVTSDPKVTEGGRPFLLLADPEEEFASLEGDIVTRRGEELFEYADLRELYISQAYEPDGMTPVAPDSGETIMESGGIPLMEKGLAKGQPYVQMFFQIQDSDWPLQPSFPVFVYNALEFLQGETGHLGYFSPGESRPLQLETGGTHRIIDEEGVEIGMFDRDEETFQAPREPGLYYLADSEEQYTYFAVNLDDREKEAVAAASFSIEGSGNGLPAESARTEWWPWLLLAGFFVLVIEWEVYRRGIRT